MYISERSKDLIFSDAKKIISGIGHRAVDAFDMFFRSQRHAEQSYRKYMQAGAEENLAMQGLYAWLSTKPSPYPAVGSLAPIIEGSDVTLDVAIETLKGQMGRLPLSDEGRLWLREDLAGIEMLMDGTIVKQRGNYDRKPDTHRTLGEFLPVKPEILEEWRLVLNSTIKVLGKQSA